MFWTLVLAAGVACHHLWNHDCAAQNTSEGWMQHLRRQLMRDNYDYEPSSDEPGLLPGLLDEPEPDPPGPRPRQDLVDLDDDEAPREDDETFTVSSLYLPTFREGPLERPPDMKQNTRHRPARLRALADAPSGASRRRQLEYVDDAWLRGGDDNRLAGDDGGGDDYRGDTRRAAQPVSKIYKFIQLSRSGRRGGPGPRFVEERGPRGLAVLSLDGAPIPQFRLPSERRQYQEPER